jgi:hypothetical protein
MTKTAFEVLLGVPMMAPVLAFNVAQVGSAPPETV